MSDPLFAGLFDKTITAIPADVAKQRYMTSVAPMAANPGKWVEIRACRSRPASMR